MSDVNEGFVLLQNAAPAYEEAHSYYEGTIGEVFSSRVLQRKLRKTGDRFKVNVIKSVPNAVADRLEILSVTVPKDEAATQRLQDIWTENGLLREAPNLHHRVSEYGDAFALVWEPPADVDGEESGDVPVINYISPLRMRVVYDVDNPRRKKYAVHSWAAKNALGAEVWRANLYYADRVEKWRTEGGKPEEAASWVPALDDAEDPDSWTLDNPYGEVPVFHWRNGTPFGLPEHFDGYGAQDAVNKLVISDMATVDYHIFPQRYALIEDDESDDDFDVDDDPDFDGDDSTETPSPGRRGLDSGPGTMQWLKGVKSVGTFEPPASDAFTSRLKTYLGLMSQTTSTPMHMLDESGDEPSGESRRRKEAPLTKKVKDRQQAYAETWAEMLSFALKVDGRRDAAVDVRYAPAEVVSDAEGWTTVKAKLEAGVPVRQALAEAGYTPEQVDEWFPEGEENTLRVADLVAVSDILQKLGAAVAMDILTAEEARALLPEGIFPEGAPAPPPTPDNAPPVEPPIEEE